MFVVFWIIYGMKQEEISLDNYIKQPIDPL